MLSLTNSKTPRAGQSVSDVCCSKYGNIMRLSMLCPTPTRGEKIGLLTAFDCQLFPRGGGFDFLYIQKNMQRLFHDLVHRYVR